MITPVENGSTLRGVHVERLRHGGAGRARVREARLARAGIGDAGVHHDRADARLVGEVLAAHAHRARRSSGSA